MCGICGIVQTSSDPCLPQKIQHMTLSLRHRGPDGLECWVDGTSTVGLGHARLSIIDPVGGAQPMWSRDNRHVLVFNGEIYNFQSLRNELEDLGCTFGTNSDTEVLLQALRTWGTSCLTKLHGMFAFALYDTVADELFLARDRIGIKPLYYADFDGVFCFASEIKALRDLASGALTLNYRAVLSHLSLAYTTPPETFFSEVQELEPGAWLRLGNRGVEHGRFWSWKRTPMEWEDSVVLERTETAILSSLSEQLVADVPLGAFLSGGIDSSLLVSMIVRSLGRRIPTFTVKFGDSTYDESRFAGGVARWLGIEHHEIPVADGYGDLSLLDEVLAQFDQPFGDSSAVPTYFICKAVKPFVKVMIGGDGGDEMFGGYPRFSYADMAEHLHVVPQWLLRGLRACCNGALLASGSDRIRQIRRLLMAAEAGGNERLFILSSYLLPPEIGAVLSPLVSQQLEGWRPGILSKAEHTLQAGGAEFIDATVTTALPGDYLRKVDMMSSMHGLEVRVPFLGESVLNCSAGIPETKKYSFTENKRILRALAKKYLPDEICGRAKTGFRFPFDTWLGEKGRHEVQQQLISPKAMVRALIRPEYVEQLLQAFVCQRWSDLRISRDNMCQRVYGLWGLERWLQRWNPIL
ncbi:MAG: asparagine synthase (glutamine-hydrolyzing) [Nitrospiraceae bacterium]|nr:asparagine synthase (glutamine-hydrolyzing) [Nitrospiraceae bacterium]